MGAREAAQQSGQHRIGKVLSAAEGDPSIGARAPEAEPGVAMRIQNAPGMRGEFLSTGVSTRPRPAGARRRSPISASNRCICAVTAEGERLTAIAALANEPPSANARKVRSSSGSIGFILQFYRSIPAKQFDF